MARPKSEDKRTALLDAAYSVFAKRGISSTPTSAVSAAAGVAEGTLFTYFPSKEVLLNAMYRALKSEMAAAILTNFPKDGDIRAKFQHVWNHYIQWGVANPDKLKVMQQLAVSEQVTAESKALV